MRPSNRANDEMRKIRITRQFTKHAEGSVLIEFGDTKVICTASVENRVPGFLRGKGQGWVTAEYGMLPRSTNSRMNREAARGGQGGRTMEIQRLIGRSLRAAVNLEALGENTISLDCDVIQADGGTRTAAITGAFVALVLALRELGQRQKFKRPPLLRQVAAVSVGILEARPLLDLDYMEDSKAEVDLNVVMTDKLDLIEVQGTAEEEPFSREQFNQMMDLAEAGIAQRVAAQLEALGGKLV